MDGRRPDPRRAHHRAEEPSPWEQQVYHDYIAGETHRQLAERHGCSHKHIQNVCKRVIAWLRPQMRELIDESQRELIDQHRHIYLESVTAWKNSIGQVVKETVTKQTGRVDRRGNPLGDEVKTERQFSSGDSRHLNTAIKALKEYRQIIGYRPPSRDDDDSERVAGRSFDDVLQRELERIEEIRKRSLGKRDAPQSLNERDRN